MTASDIATLQRAVQYLQSGSTGKFLDDIAADLISPVLGRMYGVSPGYFLDSLRDQPIPILTAAIAQAAAANGSTPCPPCPPCPPAPQDFQIAWTPVNYKLGESFAVFNNSDLSQVETLVFSAEKLANGLDVEDVPTLTSVSFPNLTTSGDADTLGFFTLASNPALQTISAPNLVSSTASLSIYHNALTSIDFSSLTTVGTFFGNLDGHSNPALVSISFPALVFVNSDVSFALCTLLANVSLPVFLPTNGKTITFDQCALTDTSVNHILARCVANPAYVSGLIEVSGGTNAAPTGQGIIDKATLQGRGVTVTTN